MWQRLILKQVLGKLRGNNLSVLNSMGIALGLITLAMISL